MFQNIKAEADMHQTELMYTDSQGPIMADQSFYYQVFSPSESS